MKTQFEQTQFHGSLDEHKQLVIETIPELSRFLVLGLRHPQSSSPVNFVSCSFSEPELAQAILNFMLLDPSCARPIVYAVSRYLETEAANHLGNIGPSSLNH